MLPATALAPAPEPPRLPASAELPPCSDEPACGAPAVCVPAHPRPPSPSKLPARIARNIASRSSPLRLLNGKAIAYLPKLPGSQVTDFAHDSR